MTQQSIEAQKAGGSSLLASESAANLKLSDYLLKSTDRLNELTQTNLKTKQQLDAVTQSDSALDEQINVLKGSCCSPRSSTSRNRRCPVSRSTATWQTISPTFACTSSRSTSSVS